MRQHIIGAGMFLSVIGLFIITPHVETPAQTIDFPGKEKIVQPEFINKFDQGIQKVRIIVLLKDYKQFQGLRLTEDARMMQAVQATISSRRDTILKVLDRSHFQLRHRFENILGFSGEATLQGVKDLAAMDEVEVIEEAREMFMNTSEGIPLIGADNVHSLGFYGSGIAIAICDTGVDYTHPQLGGGGFPNSKVIGGYDFGNNDSDPMPVSSAHGTCCAGIAAGNTGGGYAGGVAPSAKIYAMKVFEDNSDRALSDDITAAWDWCVTHKNDDPANPILIISNSFAAGYYTTTCDNLYPADATAIDNAISNGISLFASSGNGGSCDGLASPACMTQVISVGAVYDANIGFRQWCVDTHSCIGFPGYCCGVDSRCCNDSSPTVDQVTCYSNSATFLSILAPSNCAKTTDMVGSAGYSTDDYNDCFGGTSAACPYAAGAGALLQEFFKSKTGSYLTPENLKKALIDYGDSITDSKNGLTHPRINIFSSTYAYHIYVEKGSLCFCEDGTETCWFPDLCGPYKTVSKAAQNVITGTLKIKSGIYPEVLTIDKHLSLETANGEVTIGQ